MNPTLAKAKENNAELKPLLSEYESLDSQITQLTERRELVAQRVAELTCPFRVGDVITCRWYKQAPHQVLEIRPHKYGMQYEPWEIVVGVIKKDGSQGRYKRSITQSDNPVLVERA